MELKHKLSNILTKAIMRQQPIVIVEGNDDRQLYGRIAKEIKKDLKIYAVAEFEDFAAGCDNVIKCLDTLQIKFTTNPANRSYILGIIDRDSRPYRALKADEIDYRGLLGLLVLKYYSIETYFANRNSLKQLLTKATYAIESDINTEILDFVEKNLDSSFEKLYYLSLEALQNACDSTYSTVIGYSTNYTNGKDLTEFHIVEHTSSSYLLGLIMPKKANLDAFAQEKSINQNVLDLKRIAKGKWYLYNYIYHISTQIQNIQEEHKNSGGQFHSNNFYNDIFLLKIKGDIQTIRHQLYIQILECIDNAECDDIISAFQTLI